MVTAFVESPQDYLKAPAYEPQSGQIFGILNQMKETFESNLATSQKEETTDQAAYENLKSAKEKEITSGQEMLDSKVKDLGDTDEKNAQAKEDLTDTKNTLSADEEFLKMLKEQCSTVDAEWE